MRTLARPTSRSQRLMIPQRSLHVQSALNRIFPVRRNFVKAELSVQSHCIAHHRLNCVEAQSFVTDLSRICNRALRQNSAQSFAAELRAYVKTLHLADLLIQFVKSHTARRLRLARCQQQASAWRSVVSRQFREFFFKALEAKAEVQGIRVLQKQFADGADLRRRLCLAKFKFRSRYHQVLGVLCGEMFFATATRVARGLGAK